MTKKEKMNTYKKAAETEAYFLDLASKTKKALKEEADSVKTLELAFSIACGFIEYTFKNIAENYTENPKKS